MASFIGQSGNPGLFYASIGENDGIYMPSGWALAEQNGKGGNLGFRIPTLIRGQALATAQYCSTNLSKSVKLTHLEKAIQDCLFYVHCLTLCLHVVAS